MMKILIAIVGLSLSNLVYATDVQRLTFDEADVFIVRRSDIWTPNEIESKNLKLPIKNRNFTFYFYDDANQSKLGTPTGNGNIPENPIAQAIVPEIKKRKASPDRSGNWEYIQQSLLIQSGDIKPFLHAHRKIYEYSVIKAGDPEKLVSKVKTQSFFGDALSIFTMVGLGAKLGSEFATGIGGSAMNDIADLPRSLATIAIPVSLDGLDIDALPEYKILEFKRIGPREKVWANGAILIAYKQERTLELAQDLFIRSIPTALGIDTTEEAVDAAREADFQARKAIWTRCVAAADDRCK